MYHLTKFCRICIKTDVELHDIDALDFDAVRLSDKLEVCMRMVITKESLSTKICVQCIKKLRVSYEFYDMCRQSSRILQGYLHELISTSSKISPETFVNSQLRVTITPLAKAEADEEDQEQQHPHHQHSQLKRRRITKEQRCSLLKKLLSQKGTTGRRPVARIKRETDFPTGGAAHHHHTHHIHHNHHNHNHNHNHQRRGGLRGILNFTRNYDFGYKIDRNHNNSNNNNNNIDYYECTPLTRLANFTKSFFFAASFAEFRDTILYIIDNRDVLFESDEDDLEDEEMFSRCSAEDRNDSVEVGGGACEELVVEPDLLKVKAEPMEDGEGGRECDSSTYSCNYYVEASYSDSECKKENIVEQRDSSVVMIKQEMFEYEEHEPGAEGEEGEEMIGEDSMKMLDKLVDNWSLQKQTFSKHSIRCRTRDNPYINPQLKQQFEMRSFQCATCRRYFKSPGYLKAHMSKIHH